MSTAPDPTPRILIVDDEVPARNRLKDLLDDCRPAFPLMIAGEAATGLEAIEACGMAPIDIVLMDIRMPQMDGIEAAQHLMKLPSPPAVIFTTAYDGHAVQAFEVNAVDYLLKPIRRERLEAALRKAAVNRSSGATAINALASKGRSHLSIPERGRVLVVPLTSIIYLHAELKYITVKTLERDYLLEESLTSLERELEGQFTRIHRSYLVANHAIAGFEKVAADDGEPHWVVILRELDERLPVSRRQQHVVRQF